MSIAISVVIITRNAGSSFGKTLASLADFDEVVIYDNGSTDDTLAIAERHLNVRLFQGEFFGFGPTKRHAVSLAKHDWVLSLDADEQPTPALIENLRAWDCHTDRDAAAQVQRKNLLLGKVVRHSGWGRDWLVRLFNRRFCNFNDAMVHESVQTGENTQVIRAIGPIMHDAVTDLSQFLEKVNRYSSIRAENSRHPIAPALIVAKSLFAFFRTYFLRLGFLDGWRGLVIAFSNANGVFWKYMKAYALHQSS